MTKSLLLGPDDPPAATVLNPDGKAPLLLICDHASNNVPKSLANLGLPPEELARHIGWDIGVAGITRYLSRTLEAPAVLCNYSRLVIDCNRGPEESDSIPQTSDGTFIPGNQDLDPDVRQQRFAEISDPYHTTIRDLAARLESRTGPYLVFSIHSFTHQLRTSPVARPWHVAVLWDKDPRLAAPLLDGLRADPDLVVGDNEPYNGREFNYTIEQHGAVPGMPYCAIEIRQDLISSPEDEKAWGERLAILLGNIMEDPSVIGDS